MDRSAVLCSSALATLAEVPQCRPGLVAGGALRVIKSWLEMGCLVLENIRSLCIFDLHSGSDDGVFQSRFMSLFTPTFDLIANATAALMYLTGGTDGRYSSMTGSTSYLLGGGRDYIVGWIDSQILAEALPEVLVRLVLSSHESFLAADPSHGTRTVLPSVIGMYVAQTLYQLCSRAQNRQRLQGNAIPFALCMVFESTADQVKRVIHQDRQELEMEAPSPKHTDIYRCIFQYGGVNSVIPQQQTPPGTQSAHQSERLSDDVLASSLPRPPSLIRPVSSGYRSSHSQSDATPVSPESVMFAVVSSITASSLDCITCYFADEIVKNQFGHTASTKYIHPQQHPMVPKIPLIDIMCHARVIAAISMATSYLPKGHGRLSCVRIISSLTEWPQSLVALYEGSVMDVLVWISSEADDMLRVHGSKKGDHGQANVPTPHTPPNIPNKPANVERGVSNGSTISGISSSNHSAARHKDYSRDLTTPLFSTAEEENEEDEEAKMALEETLTVCTALANLCEANQQYAGRMFNCGLFTIMTRLARSSHLEVSRQALKSMHAMCKHIAAHTEEQKYAHTKQSGKNDYLVQALEVLTDSIRSPSVLVQKGAVATIAELACISHDMRDRIVEGCLRSVVSILVDPGNDREVRAAAEDVLRNVGFAQGMKDFEICGFDFEILKDWYAIQRSMKPQEEGLTILRDWLFRLFLDEEFTDERLVLQNTYDEDVFALMIEAAGILHTPMVRSDRPAYLREVDNSIHTGMSLSIPTIQRHFTDSFFKLLCSPKHLFSDNSQHNDEHDGMGKSLSRDGNSPVSQSMLRYSTAHWDHYVWIDRLPITVHYLYDLFHSSQLHMLLLTDLTSLGSSIGAHVPQEEDGDDVVYLLPHPHPVYALRLPSRSYHSFTRVGRVLQRLMDSSPAYASPSSPLQGSKLFALCFTESDFHGDFHTSLLSTLQRCPQICSLSFSSSVRVEEDALLGHLVGHIPSSVKFVSFKSTLSKESVQAMCILLRTHNEAFLPCVEAEAETSSSSPTPSSASDVHAPSQLSSSAHKGLLGLALTHLTLEQSELDHLLDLLTFRPLNKSPSFKTKDSGKLPPAASPKGALAASPPSAPGTPGMSLSQRSRVLVRGLRYVDLSHNRLTDMQCASVLQACLTGSVEGLELGGNCIYRAQKVLEILESYTQSYSRLSEGHVEPVHKHMLTSLTVGTHAQGNSYSHSLRYLGLSRNNLTPKAFSSLLQKLQPRSSLRHVDLSANGVEAGAMVHDVLRSFLKRNNSMRVLDLSYNKLNEQSCKEIHLGLLENSTLLFLPLAGNMHIEHAKTVELIQHKLRENRLLYKVTTLMLTHIHAHCYAVMYIYVYLY
ncbi:hypothetical protein EON64_07385, partial [archaeon]